MTAPSLVSLKDAAERLGLHPGVMWRMVTNQGFPGVRIGGVWRVRLADVEDAIARGWQPKRPSGIRRIK